MNIFDNLKGKENKKENRVGLYSTIIFHLLLIITMLICSIETIMKEETSFILDFTQQEELEARLAEEKMKESVSKELDDLLSKSKTIIRNAVVDRSSGERLKDDRSKNPSEVYNDAKRLQEKLNMARQETEKLQGSDDEVIINKGNQKEVIEAYKGPSIVSYKLMGRKAISLPIPAYKCIIGGDVTIAIAVNRSGYVTNAEIVDAISVNDDCVRNYAIKAAKRSRFTASSSAKNKQIGEITYRFVAQ